LALDQARQRQEWERQQSERLLASRQHAAEEIAAIESDQARLREELAGAEASLQKSTADLESLSLVEAQADAAQWETKLAVAQRALADAEARLAERQAAHERIEAQHGELQARFEAVEQQLGDLQGTIGAARGSEGDLGREIAELSSLIEPDEKELHAAELEHDRLLEEEAAARQTLSVAERHYNQAQLAFGRSQESLDTLRGRIEDDFGLVEFDYDDSVSGPTPLPLGALVERLPHVAELSPETEGNLKRQRAQLRRMGSINPEAQKEYEEVTERFAFLSVQVEDLTKAEADMRAVIAELDELMEREFRVTFERVAVEFRDIFTRLFGGGTAKLVLTDSGDMAEAGIDIEARLPGKRAQRLALLSGGERSLTAAALVFALLKASPTPFCVMDEVDAMLDEANVSRFRDLLTELSRQTQFVVITHNRSTVQAADVIYGITMGRDTSSQTISLKLDEVDERYSE
jgi:chromosome segregation protein